MPSSRAVRRGEQRALVIDEFWKPLRSDDDLDPAIWRVLEPIDRQVRECLDRVEPRYGEAESLTAQAQLLLAGLLRP